MADEILMRLIDAYADAAFDQGLHQRTEDDAPESKRQAIVKYLAATPAPARDDGMPASADERHLRRLLAARVGMPHTYFDDGEAQGAQHGISIDFMREPVADIDAKLRALNVARYEVAKAATPAPVPRGWVCQKCGVDRCKEACPKGHTAALTGDCPMVGTARLAGQGKEAP